MDTIVMLGTHGGPGWWIVFPILWFAVFVLVASLFWRRRRGWCAYGVGSGESVLAERFARGEITDAEYRDRLSVLRERRR
jgi:putative membrane protein